MVFKKYICCIGFALAVSFSSASGMESGYEWGSYVNGKICAGANFLVGFGKGLVGVKRSAPAARVLTRTEKIRQIIQLHPVSACLVAAGGGVIVGGIVVGGIAYYVYSRRSSLAAAPAQPAVVNVIAPAAIAAAPAQAVAMPAAALVQAAAEPEPLLEREEEEQPVDQHENQNEQH